MTVLNTGAYFARLILGASLTDCLQPPRIFLKIKTQTLNVSFCPLQPKQRSVEEAVQEESAGKKKIKKIEGLKKIKFQEDRILEAVEPRLPSLAQHY